MTLSFFQLVFWTLFVLGTVGLFLNRRNFVVMLMCIELMLLLVNTLFLTLSVQLDDLNGRLMALYVMTLALAETALGLLLCVLHYRTRLTLDVDAITLLKG